MKHIFFLLLVMLTFVLTPYSTFAEESEETRKQIAERFPGVEPEDVQKSPIAGLFEVMAGPIVIYTSADGRYMVRGDIYDLQTEKNITEPRVEKARTRALAKLSDDEVIIFGKPDAEHTVTVFTDIDCSYCRVLHENIKNYEQHGIRVRYAAFPREGLASSTWNSMEQVWCADDRQHALTQAKRDRKFDYASCDADELVAEQWQLGRMLGVRGTPAIFTSTGKMIAGYLPPAKLKEKLNELAEE